ncbi:autotransporter assembly complex protein TamA [Pseudooceanicola algae]|uniref:autotransporter assembly complex protein TamA n=1 Tax=Pseudooceanicola algae TaxID=1537215 RepID=UPI0018AD14DA|nr:BamA/TamA family outer membrane protein [Pseudooceanicola algae]
MKTLRAASLSVKAVETDEITDAQELIAAAKADYKRMIAALYDEGYFGPDVSIKIDGREAVDVSALQRNVTAEKILISVEPGPLFTFSQAEIDPLPTGSEPPAGFTVGATAKTSVIRQAGRTGITDWRQAGYPLADVTGQQITANHADSKVAASFDVTPGPQLTFGTVTLSPDSYDSNVRPERILEIAGLPEGEVYDPDEVSKAADRMRRTGAFSSAVVTEDDHASAGDTLGTTIEVRDARLHRIGAGVEISSTEGLSLSGYWMNRNLWGGAERLRFDAEIEGLGVDTGGYYGGIDYSLEGSLTRPAFHHPDMDLVFGFELSREDEPDYLSDVGALTVGLERYINEDLTGSLEVGLRLNRSRDDLGTRDFLHFTTTGGLTWDNRNSEFDATKGFYADVEVTPFVGLNGVDSSGVRSEADLRAYQMLGSEKLVLAGWLQVGSVVGPSIVNTPSDWLFYSGGGGSVRGQGYKSLGVTNGSVTTGGRSYAAISTEVRSKFTDTIGGAVFVDYGYVAEDETFTGGEWQGGAGLGLRYFTPIGPIRLDLAVPVTGDSDAISMYVGIGQAF